MREIKFRGKRVDNGEWVEGSFFASHMSGAFILSSKIEARKNRSGGMMMKDKLEQHEVHPATVGQYTGLKDKAGKEIYEGDIVCAYNGKYIGEVFYQAPEFAIQNFKELRLNFFEYMPNDELNFEVIGNIHDNDPKGGESE